MFVCFGNLQVFDAAKFYLHSHQLRKPWSFPHQQVCHLRFDFSPMCVFKCEKCFLLRVFKCEKASTVISGQEALIISSSADLSFLCTGKSFIECGHFENTLKYQNISKTNICSDIHLFQFPLYEYIRTFIFYEYIWTFVF